VGGAQGGMKSFEGGVVVKGEAVGLVKEGLGFCVTANLVGYLETNGDWVGLYLLLATC
jgi:hypothetical protein